ncbi:MAG: peptidylprolyl isomerase [Planctomycetota bacterium]
MSSSSAPTQGQIEAPNPLELFWERHRRSVLIALTLLGVALIANYGLRYFKKQETNTRWSEVATSANLDAGYTEQGSLWSLLSNQNGSQFLRYYLSQTQEELVFELGRDLEAADDATIDAALADQAGTAAEPLLQWVAAVKAAKARDFDRAAGLLNDLEQNHPEHVICASSSYPTQYRPEIPSEDEEEDERKKRDEPPELEAPAAGSLVALLRAEIERQQTFRQATAWLYEAPAVDASPRVVFKLSNDEEFEVGFYAEQAPQYVAAFLANARKSGEEAPFFEGIAIDEVQREGPAGTPEQLHFGLASTKDEQDRTKWLHTAASGKVLDFVDNDLSHLPFMVAAAPEPAAQNKSSGERVWINVSDAAVRFDGQRVIFGRVTRGEEVLQRLATELPLTTAEMETNGSGQLQTDVRITSVTIIGDVPPEEAPPGEEGK